MHSYFDLFNLPARFELDNVMLERHYRTAAAQCHPDKFAAASAFEQKQAVMMAATLNEAYRTLKDPLNRAAYLLQAAGLEADAPEYTHFDADFLMQQMAWRETLAQARAERNEDTLHTLSTEIQTAQNALFHTLATAFDANNFEAAADLVRQGRFLGKLQQEIQAAVP